MIKKLRNQPYAQKWEQEEEKKSRWLKHCMLAQNILGILEMGIKSRV
jgi:hypothetical protein